MEKDKHCSYCDYFYSHPGTNQMYCEKLQRRITGRKKACKFYRVELIKKTIKNV